MSDVEQMADPEALQPAPTDENGSESSPEQDAAATGDRDSGDNPAPTNGAEEEPTRKGGLSKRFGELTDRLRAAEQALGAREAEVERMYGLLQRGQTPEQAAGARDADAEPDRNKFDDYEAFLEARSRWAAREAVRDEYEQRDRLQSERSRAEVNAAREARWEASHNSAYERLEGYHEAFEAVGTSINPVVAEAIKDSDAPADVVYWLAKNPATLQKLGQMTGPSAIREVGRIEERLTTNAQRSAAPTPPKPVRGNTSGTKNPLDMRLTTDEWIKNRRALRAKAQQRSK